MAAQIKIDQATLAPAGTAGKSRTDGLAGGQLVTLTNTGTGSTTRFRLLWVPVGDTTAVASLVQTGPKVWTFSPTAAKPGTYRIELIEDEGLPNQTRQRRVLRVRTPNRGLVIPALNETGDPSASLANAGAAQIAAAEDNSDDWTSNLALNGVRYAAWWRLLHELVTALDTVPSTFDTDAITNESTLPGASLTDALDGVDTSIGALQPAAAGENGFVSKNTYDNSNAPTFTTAAQVPVGDHFLGILDGGGGSGGGGAATVSGNNFAVGGGAGGGGARKEFRLTRAQFIALLPVSLVLPAAVLGGAGASTAGALTAGANGNPGGTAEFRSNGVAVFKAFGGGRGSASTVGSASAGGGGGGHHGVGGDATTTNGGNGGAPIGGATGGPAGDSIYGGGGGTQTGADSLAAGKSVWGGGGGGRGLPTTSTKGTDGGFSSYGGGGGGGGGGSNPSGSADAAIPGGVGGGHEGTLGGAAGSSLVGAGTGGVGGPGVAANELVGGTGGGGGGGHSRGGANALGGAGGDGGAGGGGGGGGGGATADSGTAVAGAGGAGGKPQFILIGLR